MLFSSQVVVAVEVVLVVEVVPLEVAVEVVLEVGLETFHVSSYLCSSMSAIYYYLNPSGPETILSVNTKSTCSNHLRHIQVLKQLVP